MLSWAVAPEMSALAGDRLSPAPTLRIASLAGSRDELPRAAGQLTEAEKARSLRFLRPGDRERFILGRWLAKSMLGAMFGLEGKECEFEADPNGKPRLRARPDIAFNIAHSGDIVMVGVGARMQLGVDVELQRDGVEFDGVSRLIFTSSERDAVLRGTEEEHKHRFFRLWALKEALVKALGTGLMLDPRRFAIDQSVAPLQLTFVGASPDDVGNGWIVTDVPAPAGYSAAVAWRCLDDAEPATIFE